jgi:hypothetical protein
VSACTLRKADGPPEWARESLPAGASQRTPRRVPLRVVS